jgi:hypothetical protein
MWLFACSGPGAGAAIARSIEIGYAHAAIAGGFLAASLVLLALCPQRRAIPAILTVLLALHPAWTISAIEGDCGYFKREASWVFTGLGGIALCWQLVRVISSRAGAMLPEQRHAEADGGASSRSQC